MNVNKSINKNNFVITIATVNGSGSQSANNILLKTLFRMGVPVGGKNVFPSNIAGLPTWFWIRAEENGYVARRAKADIFVGMNPQTLLEDLKTLRSGGFFIYNSDLGTQLQSDLAQTIVKEASIQLIPISFKPLVDQSTDSIKVKKLVINMIYVGVLAKLLNLDLEVLNLSIADQFENKDSVITVNKKAAELGYHYAETTLKDIPFPYQAITTEKNKNKVLMEGNTAAALGWLFGGCTFTAWYPITPSSSIVEKYIQLAQKYRKTSEGKNKFAVIQAEDELSSICMVLGAGWAGARSVTATSGPGLSLMAEAAGFSYFTEIPSVIWDVQRVGPSTGMPTRTAQGDLLSAVHLSHGDTKNPCLLPGNIQECFEFGQTAFDLAERLQQLVIVLSDLDLGMNLWMENKLTYPEKPFDRGKVLNAEDLEKIGQFERYGDPDKDGIPYRTLPGTWHEKASYFTRGSGHNAKAAYTEKSDEYQFIVDRLAKKWETAKTMVPAPVYLQSDPNLASKDQASKDQASKTQGGKVQTKAQIGIIAYGSSDLAVKEAMHLLKEKNIETHYCRIRAVPLTPDILDFIQQHEVNFVVDQNRDGQMCELLKSEFNQVFHLIESIRHYDGTPITAESILEPIVKFLVNMAERRN
jgi:2-oxoglutarate ferredoxin oxidoreductase subunit alpha